MLGGHLRCFQVLVCGPSTDQPFCMCVKCTHALRLWAPTSDIFTFSFSAGSSSSTRGPALLALCLCKGRRPPLCPICLSLCVQLLRRAVHLSMVSYLLLALTPFQLFFFLSLPFLGLLPVAYGGSQTRGRIGGVAAGLRHSHSNARI